MKRVIAYFPILVFVCISCAAPMKVIFTDEYDPSVTNVFLELNANSSVRLNETVLQIESESKAILMVKEAITIFDKEDKYLARQALFYDKFVSIDSFDAVIKDSKGNTIKSYSIKDASDYSNSDGFSFFSDNRVKVLQLLHNTFPYTIEVSYQQTFNGLLSLPTWAPLTLKQSLESASFTLIDKSKSGVRFLEKNLGENVKFSSQEKGKIYKWEMGLTLAKDNEVLGSSPRDLLPHVLLAPTKFQMDDSFGDASSWKEFGSWYYELGKNTRELPLEAKKEIDTLIEGVEKEEEKVRILYEYLQNKMRYVSIQLGIGGWKPFPVDYVFTNNYGDCKALTNYMQAILEYAGIKANAVLLNSGVNAPKLEEGFPSNQFNHVILRVELESGEIVWLECTSKYLLANRVGIGNEGKKVLMITKEGGEIITIPPSSFKENRNETISVFNLKLNGDSELKSEVVVTGFNQDFILSSIIPVSEKERLNWINEQVGLDNVKILDYDLSSILNKEEHSSYSYKAQIPNYSSKTTSRIFFPINSLNEWSLKIPKEEKRDQPLYFPYMFSDIDSTVFILPEGYEIESIPKDNLFEHSFGSYQTSATYQEGKVVYVRRFEIKKSIIDTEEFQDFTTFFDDVRTADQQQVVAVKEK